MHLVLNNCNDKSARVVSELSHELDGLVISVTDVRLTPDRSHVGVARRLAM